MSTNSTFFDSPQAAAIYKHKLLKTYIPVWAGKVGSTSANAKVIVYDAYSGPGRYANDQPGSPELLVDTAESMAKLRTVHTIFSEKNKTYCEELKRMLDSKGVDPATFTVLEGPVELHLDDVIVRAGQLPLFVFLDPFGLTVPFEQVKHILTARDTDLGVRAQQPKTELLINFSYEAVRRIAGVLRSPKDYPARDGQIRALDEALGGNWWHDLARAEREGWVNEILVGFADRVGKAAKFGYVTADVADSLRAQPVYELILFTRHNDGIWAMANSMSSARHEWRQWLIDRRVEESGGQLELRGLDFEDHEDAWCEDIATNVERLLAKGGPFTIESELGEVLGKTLGLARETHIRKALRLLKTRGVILEVPKGKLQHAQILPS